MNPSSTAKTILFWLSIVLLGVMLWRLVSANGQAAREETPSYSEFMVHVDQGDVKEVTMYLAPNSYEMQGEYVKPANKKFRTTIFKEDAPNLTKQLRDKQVAINVKEVRSGDWLIILLNALPLLLLPFGSPKSASVAFWSNTRSSWFATGIAAVAAIASASAVWPLIATGFDRAWLDAAHFHPLLLGRFGLYQAALLALIAACMIAYAAIWQVSAAETLASMFAVAAGASIALLALDVQYDANNIIAVLNPLEKMLTFADAKTTDAASGSSPSGILLLLFDGMASVLARYSFVLHPAPRPTVFLTWLIVPGIVVAWRRGDRLVAIQALALLLAAIGIDALGVRRGLKSEYFIFTDPLIIIAGAILLDCLSDLRFRKWAYPLAVTLFGLHIAIGQAEPIKYALKRSGPESTCEWSRYYLPLLPLPWCAAPPARS